MHSAHTLTFQSPNLPDISTYAPYTHTNLFPKPLNVSNIPASNLTRSFDKVEKVQYS